MDVRWDGYPHFRQQGWHSRHACPRQCAYRLGSDAGGTARLCVEQLATLREDWWCLGTEQRDGDRHFCRRNGREYQRFQHEQRMDGWNRRGIRLDSQLDPESGVGFCGWTVGTLAVIWCTLWPPRLLE